MFTGKPILYAINLGNKPLVEANGGISGDAENLDAIADGILKFYNFFPEQKIKLRENGEIF